MWDNAIRPAAAEAATSSRMRACRYWSYTRCCLRCVALELSGIGRGSRAASSCDQESGRYHTAGMKVNRTMMRKPFQVKTLPVAARSGAIAHFTRRSSRQTIEQRLLLRSQLTGKGGILFQKRLGVGEILETFRPPPRRVTARSQLLVEKVVDTKHTESDCTDG